MTVSKRAVGLRGVGLAAYLTITAPAGTQGFRMDRQ